jgi:hypothetical protein
VYWEYIRLNTSKWVIFYFKSAFSHNFSFYLLKFSWVDDNSSIYLSLLYFTLLISFWYYSTYTFKIELYNKNSSFLYSSNDILICNYTDSCAKASFSTCNWSRVGSTINSYTQKTVQNVLHCIYINSKAQDAKISSLIWLNALLLF